MQSYDLFLLCVFYQLILYFAHVFPYMKLNGLSFSNKVTIYGHFYETFTTRLALRSLHCAKYMKDI